MTKPCPFCSSVDVDPEYINGYYYVICFNCFAQGPRGLDYQDSKNKWNQYQPQQTKEQNDKRTT